MQWCRTRQNSVLFYISLHGYYFQSVHLLRGAIGYLSFCLIQNYITNSVSMVLLAFSCAIAVQSLWIEISSFDQSQPVVSHRFIILFWFVPQALYCFTIKCQDHGIFNDFHLEETYYNVTFSPSEQELSVQIGNFFLYF